MLFKRGGTAQCVILGALAGSGLAAIRARHGGLLPDQCAIRIAEQRYIRHRQRAQCLAVVTVFQTDELRLARLGDLAPVMPVYFERVSLRGGAVRAIKAMPQPGWSQAAQPLGKLHYRLMGETRQHHMLQRLKLVAQSGVDARVAMPEQIHPPGADRIQVTFPVIVVQPHTLAARNRHQRKILIMLHLRAWMPDSRQAARKKTGISWSMILHTRNHSGFCGMSAG